jgi:hypothetical protein
MGKGPRRLRAPASPGGQPGPSPDKPARPPQRTTCGSPRVSHIWRPTQSWSGMLLRRRFVAGPAPRPAPLGTPADEATSTHTGLDDYYYSYYYEPPARRPRLRCHVPWPATTRSPGKPWGPPQLALTSTMTDWAVAPSLAAGHHRAPAAVVCPSRRLQRPRPRARAACWALSSGRRPHPTPSTATTTSSRNLQHIHTNDTGANLVTPMAVTPSTGPSSFVLRSLPTRKATPGCCDNSQLCPTQTSEDFSHMEQPTLDSRSFPALRD